ncbi:MAG TPA: hypothetical protein DDZ99_09470 [Clostridiales bacterium]|nr:hypothetical protein [Clostridiales bacterium]
MSKFTKMAEKPEPALKIIGKLVMWLIIIPLLTWIVFIYYDAALFSFSPIIIKYNKEILVVILSIIIIPRIFRYIKALIKRILFIKKLRRICIYKGFRFIQMRNFYLSIFMHNENPELLVVTDARIYIVSLFTALKRRKALHFISDKTVIEIYNFLKAMPPKETKKYYHIADIDLPDYITTPLPIEKILLVNPVPYKITRTSEYGIRLVDNNEKMFGYTLYMGTGFCNMLDRL